jgi:hypothetical protein
MNKLIEIPLMVPIGALLILFLIWFCHYRGDVAVSRLQRQDLHLYRTEPGIGQNAAREQSESSTTLLRRHPLTRVPFSIALSLYI